MNIRPIGDRVLVRHDNKEEAQTSSGIVLPGEETKKPYGVIEALGTGDKVEKYKLNVGDKILFEGWGGQPVDKELFGENLVILSVDKVIAIYE